MKILISAVIAALLLWLLWDWVVVLLAFGLFAFLAEMSMMVVFLLVCFVGYGAWWVVQRASDLW